MPITTVGVRAFRAAATLADVLPRARIQVRDGERTLVTVSRTPINEVDDGLVLPPCAFRTAVAHAYRRSLQGARVELMGLAADREPTIEVELREGDTALPGQIYRVRAGNGRHLLLFLSGLGTAACHEAVTTAVDDAAGSEHPSCGSVPRPQVGCHHDLLTDITVVHAVAGDPELQVTGRVMTRLLEVCVAAEVISELAATPPPSLDGGGRER